MQTTIGCYSTCHKEIKDGACSGGGCCQADVPKNMTYYQAYFNDMYNDTTDLSTPCSYTVMMEKEAFSFSTTYLSSTVFNDTYKGMAPVVLEWHVGEEPCEVARRNASSYACLSRDSECVDSPNQPGYRCRCMDGYKGNPYINGGCTGPALHLINGGSLK
jgi:hypothetical protein